MRHPICSVPAVIVALLTFVLPALAASTPFSLGKPTNATSSNPNFPLSGFHKAGPFLRSHGKPELLWLGTAWPGDISSGWERWPVIKALEQFGTFTNVGAERTICGKPEPYGFVRNGSQISYLKSTPCTLPAPDWSKAQYRSRYITFVSRDLIDGKGYIGQPLNSTEGRLFDRYVRRRSGESVPSIAASINLFLFSSGLPKGRPESYFPLVSIGGYLQTVTQTGFLGDLTANTQSSQVPPPSANLPPTVYFLQALSFDAIRSALATGKTPSVPSLDGQSGASFPSLVPDINGEANIITALICHADGKAPASVCDRSVIKQILRHVK